MKTTQNTARVVNRKGRRLRTSRLSQAILPQAEVGAPLISALIGVSAMPSPAPTQGHLLKMVFSISATHRVAMAK